MRILELTEETRSNILENLLKRSPNSYGEFEGRVDEIIARVKKERDAAVFAYTRQFDGADICADNILVTEEEIKEAYASVDPKLLGGNSKGAGEYPGLPRKAAPVFLV